MVAKPIKDAVKALKEIIDQNGLNYLADEPYRVYEKLLESGTADRKTAAVLLHLLSRTTTPVEEMAVRSALSSIHS